MKKILVLMFVLGMDSFVNATVIDVVKDGMGSKGHAGTATDPLVRGETIGIKLVMNFNATTSGLPAGTRAGYLLSSMSLSMSVSGGGTLDAGTKDTYGTPIWQKNVGWSTWGFVDADEDYSDGWDEIGAGALNPIYPASAGAITDLFWDLIITCTDEGPVTIDLGINGTNNKYAQWRASDNRTPVPNGVWLQMTNADLGDLTVYQIPEPMTLALLVSRTGYDRVSRYSGFTGEYLGEFISSGCGGLDGPWGITFGPDGNLYVASEETDTILCYNGKTGVFIDEFVTPSSPCPRTILFGSDGNLYIADECMDAVFRYNGQTGDFMGIFTSGYNPDNAFGMAFGPDGNLYVTDDDPSGQVVRFNGTTGEFVDVFAVGLDSPSGLIFGPDGNLYVADRSLNKIKRYNGQTGAFIDDFVTSGSGGLSNAEGTILFGPDGNLYVASHNSGEILRYDGQTGDFIDEFASVADVTFFTFVELPIGGYIGWMDIDVFCNLWLETECNDVDYWCQYSDINHDGSVDFSDFIFLGQYWKKLAPEPNAATNPDPNDGSTSVSIIPDLSWTPGQAAACHGVYFGTNPMPYANNFQGYFQTHLFDSGPLAPNTTYYWQVNEAGLGGETTGAVWSFTTAPVPGRATNPVPNDTATGIIITDNLNWNPGTNATSHNVYFGINPTPGPNEFQGNQISTTFDPGILDYETTYYWRIDEVGPGGTKTGQIWHFTTELAPVPGQSINPYPANEETDVNTLVCLSWIDGPNTTSHDVYFGTVSPPPFITDQSNNTFCPTNGLEYYTIYYWRIDERNPYNVTIGEEWSFTTRPEPNLVGWWKFNESSGIIAYDSSTQGNHGMLMDGLNAGLTWEPVEGVLRFEGSNNLSRISVPTTGMKTTTGTISIWANLSYPQIRSGGRAGQAYFFGCDNGGTNKILLYMSNSDTQLDMKIGNYLASNIITLNTQTWYHISLTWNAGAYAVYVNGSPLETGTYGGLGSLPSMADIGNNGDSHTQSLHGLVNETRIYNRALSATEVEELYQSGPD